MSETPQQLRPRRRWRWLAWAAAGFAVLCVAAALVAALLWRQAQPFFRQRAIAALESTFHAHVQLDDLEFTPGAVHQVTGRGLRITPIGLEGYPPAIQVRSFTFRLNFWDILSPYRHVRFAQVDGLVLTLPPPAQRKAQHTGGVTGNHSRLLVDAFVCNDAQLNILHNDPQKAPLSFTIHKLKVTTPLLGGPLHYDATLVNPQPRGDIHAVGTFGPWSDDNPRATPVTGDFTFTNADLSTIRGIAGTLSSTGHFAGPIDRLVVDGTTQTPDFRLQESGHPVALFTTYHAVVDGTTGDTYLQPVQAHFRNTYFTCAGSITNIRGQGHHTLLDITMQRGRVEDVLWLATRSATPVIKGALTLHSKLDLPPNSQQRRTVLQRLWLNGNFRLTGVEFTNNDWDRRIDEVSLRTQGRPEEAEQISDQKGRDDIRIASRFSGNFTLDRALLSLHPALFQMPGVDADINGSYALDVGNVDFNGQAKLDVPISKMVTGWKSSVARLVDPLFRRQGAPAVVSFRVAGPRDNPTLSIQLFKGFSVGMRREKR